MDMQLDFSVFLSDGSAFGKASYDISLGRMLKVGEVFPLSELLSQSVKSALPSDDIHFAEAELGKLSVAGVTSLSSASAGTSLLVEIEDIVIGSREIATRLLDILTAVGFDCDVWS